MSLIVITGATSGVGLAASERFVVKGWTVVGIARDHHKLAKVREQLGGNFVPEALDVRVAADVRSAFERISKLTGCIDVLINNAAVFKMKPFAEFTDDEIDEIIDTNLKGTLYCTRAAIPLLVAGSRIINIGSVAGTHGIPGQAAYCASKHGIEGFADAIGQELRTRSIAVTTIAPGGIETPLWNSANPYPGEPGTLLSTNDVVSMIEYVAALPAHVILKHAVLFPSNEWH